MADLERRLDAEDPLAHWRARFHVPPGPDGRPVAYFCGNSLGLMPVAARDAVEEELEAWQRLAVRGHFEARHPWYSYHEVFRETGARLVGAATGEVVMMNSLTVNLHLCLTTFYRPTPERHEVLMGSPGFPSDTYAVESRIRLAGFDPARSLVAVPLDQVLAALEERGRRVALVLLEGVHFLTGRRTDMARVAEAARRAGAFVGFDLAHAAGNVPLALHDWGVDFAVWCSYKYLNSGPGAIAGCFVHERHGRDTSLPRLAGWWGNDPATRFRMHLESTFVPREGADGWQISNPPILAMAPLRASLAIFDQVGMKALREKSLRLTGHLADLLARIGREHFELVTPGDPEARGCQLSIRVRKDPRGVQRALEEEGVVCDFREPDVLRVAPVPLYNTFADVRRFADVLARRVGVALP